MPDYAPLSPDDLRQMLCRQARRWGYRVCHLCAIVREAEVVRIRTRHTHTEGIGNRVIETCTHTSDTPSLRAWIAGEDLHVVLPSVLYRMDERHWVLQRPTPIQAEALLAYSFLYGGHRERERKRFRLTLTWLGVPMGTSSFISSLRNR